MRKVELFNNRSLAFLSLLFLTSFTTSSYQKKATLAELPVYDPIKYSRRACDLFPDICKDTEENLKRYAEKWMTGDEEHLLENSQEEDVLRMRTMDEQPVEDIERLLEVATRAKAEDVRFRFVCKSGDGRLSAS